MTYTTLRSFLKKIFKGEPPLDSKGMSLPEVMVALGVSGVLALGAVSTSQLASTTSSGVRYQKAVGDFENIINSAIAFRESCGVALAGNDFSAVPVPGPMPIVINVSGIGPVQAGSPVLGTRARVQTLDVRNIQALALPGDQTVYYGSLLMSLERIDGGGIGSRISRDRLVGGITFVVDDVSGGLMGCAGLATNNRSLGEVCNSYEGQAMFNGNPVNPGDPGYDEADGCILPPPEMGCPVGEYLVGIVEGVPQCRTLGGSTCDGDRILRGAGLGRVDCDPAPDAFIHTPISRIVDGAPPVAPPPPVVGQCGPANGGSFPDADAVNMAGLCSVGTAPAVAGPGDWTWTCSAADGDSPLCTASAESSACSWSMTGTSSGMETTCNSPSTYFNYSCLGSSCLSSSGTSTSGSGHWDILNTCNTTRSGQSASITFCGTGVENNESYTCSCTGGGGEPPPCTLNAAYGGSSVSFTCSTSGPDVTISCTDSSGFCSGGIPGNAMSSIVPDPDSLNRCCAAIGSMGPAPMQSTFHRRYCDGAIQETALNCPPP